VISTRLALTRDQILAFRQRAGGLTERLPHGAGSLRQAAWAGLQDSMPRAALLSIHARVEGTHPTAWEDPSLVQVWGPRFSAYVVAAVDAAVFTLGRLPDDAAGLKRAESTADRLEAFLAGRTMSYADAGHGMGIGPNMLRYGAATGRIQIRWEGARRPTIWTVPRPVVEPQEARRELARRYLTVLGPGTADTFAEWAGIKAPRAGRIFDSLAPELAAVRTPIGDGWILAADEPSFGRAATVPDPSVVRLLPSGDAWFLLWGADRGLLVPDAARRGGLWTSRVWPGAIFVGGEIAGVWRRASAAVSLVPWRALSPAERDGVVAEAESLPLPDVAAQVRVSWEDAAV
jgi:hypothetical protein